jgi:capsid protein
MWIPAGMPSVDPLRDGKADIDAINAKLKSPQQVILARGDDPEEVLMQHGAWIALCEQYGVDPSAAGIDTTLANNPAKLGAAEEFEG